MFKFSNVKKAVSATFLYSSFSLFAYANADVIEFIPGETQVQNGDVVAYNSECFLAKNTPGVWETPSAASWFWDAVDCDYIEPPVDNVNWSAGKVYTKSDRAKFNSVTYEAQHWTQGDNPEESGEYGPWKAVDGDIETPPVDVPDTDNPIEPDSPLPDTENPIAPDFPLPDTENPIEPDSPLPEVENPIICADDSIVEDIEDCAVVEEPITCEDGETIVDNIEDCPIIEEPITCEDGETIVDNIEDCPIIEEPITCEDGETIVDNIEDCPIIEEPITCADGETIVDNIEDCPIIEEPITCEDGKTIVDNIEDCPIVEAPPEEGPGVCSDFNVYPDWTNGDHAASGDIMVHGNVAYRASYYTMTPPGSDTSWIHEVNCDGTEKGEAAHLSMRNLSDPISLKMAGFPKNFVVATASSDSRTTTVDTLNTNELSDTAKLTASFKSLINAAEQAGTSSVIISSDALDQMSTDKGASLSTIAVKQALTDAVKATGANITSAEIAALTDNSKGWAQAQNLIMTKVAPNATFGWSLELGEFAYETHSGKRAVWNAASEEMADLLDNFELYTGKNKADFVSFTKSTATASFSDSDWHNALTYVKQVSDFITAPAMLSSIPTSQAATYFMGSDSSESHLRKAAHNNVFALSFDASNTSLDSKIAAYESNKMPLYNVAENTTSSPLTRIPALNEELEAAEHVMDNEVFLYEVSTNVWAPSTIYKWNDFLDGLNPMHNIGVAGDTFWLLDENADDATNTIYAKVALAAFLSQTMQETIRYDACDENNWAEVIYGAVVDHPNAASCGQLGQKYADYGVNEFGRDHAYSCPRDAKMEVTATTHAKWYGAPAPIFAAPDSVMQEAGKVGANGFAGRWERDTWCADIPTKVDESKQAWEREECQIYVGQKAGGFIFDGSSQESVEGCGWWGRGVIQTTGRQNFGTLNHYLGRSHIDPAKIGTTIDGVKVEAPPANPLYADKDLCSNPQLICSSEENAEIKWIAGLFFWVNSVQGYENAGGPYEGWDYVAELKAYVDGGLVGTQFVDDVSGIVNRGCPDLKCPESGDVHNFIERRANFKLVLETLGLSPK